MTITKKIFVAQEPKWEFDAFEPYVSEKAMFVHWDMLHKRYVNNLNEMLVEYPELVDIPASQVLKNTSFYLNSEDDKQKYLNNMGGHFCHTLFWYVLSPSPSKQSSFFDRIGISQKQMEKDIIEQGMSRFGSGWSWLAIKNNAQIECYSTQNHSTPFMRLHQPILCVDLWEHAYYLDYLGQRKDWLTKIVRFIDWDKVSHIYDYAKKYNTHLIDGMLVGKK